MSHRTLTCDPPPWNAEHHYNVFVEHLSPKSRAAVQKHDELCEADSLPRHHALWKRFAGRLGNLAGHAIESSGPSSVKFFIADGKYKLQVFALEDSRRGSIVVYFPDVTKTAITRKILAAGPTSQLYKVHGSAEPLQLDFIDAETRDLSVCKAMVGWGRRAVRAELAAAALDEHVQAVEDMCEMAAQQWAQHAP